jgi:hypothetical protein
MRDRRHTSDVSGMCAVCTTNCPGPCEIGLSAIRGSEAILPFSADKNQFASEKHYPLDSSHFNINGRVFGAIGLPADPYQATHPNADISSSFGAADAVEIKAPFILPAIAKLAWKEYFAGAALSGIPVVVGEALNRKFALQHISREGIVRLTEVRHDHPRGCRPRYRVRLKQDTLSTGCAMRALAE